MVGCPEAPGEPVRQRPIPIWAARGADLVVAAS